MVGPEGILVVSFWPFIRNLTLVPPTSTTRTFGEAELDLVCVLSGIVLSARKYISSSPEFGGTTKKYVDFHLSSKDDSNHSASIAGYGGGVCKLAEASRKRQPASEGMRFRLELLMAVNRNPTQGVV